MSLFHEAIAPVVMSDFLESVRLDNATSTDLNDRLRSDFH